MVPLTLIDKKNLALLYISSDLCNMPFLNISFQLYFSFSKSGSVGPNVFVLPVIALQKC